MSDISQTNLKEPDKLDWENAFKGSSYSPPPPAVGADGKPIVYFGQVTEAKESPGRGLDKDYLNYELNFKLVRSGAADGTQVRTWASTRTFSRLNKDTGEYEPLKGNPNALAKFLKAAGVNATPQRNSEYQAAVKAVNGKAIGFTIDWEASNKERTETVKGYLNFPDDPERPGQKKSILKKGDVYQERDSKGNVLGEHIVDSEILFANARIKYFQDPTRGTK